MTTRSSSPSSNDPAIPTAPSEAADGDPVGGLLHAAVADRPVEDVARLITLLERSPEHAGSTVQALRTVGVDRSVEDVTRLVDLLTRPPRTAEGADETIRAAAERRPVEDVSRLVGLLHRTDLQPHCGRLVVRAAATGRPVEELVELIRRLSAERDGLSTPDAPPEPPAAPPRPVRPPIWPGRLTVAALVVCAVAYFPLRPEGFGLRVYALALGLSVACLAVALLLTLRTTAPFLVTAALLPAALAAAQLLDDRLPLAPLSRSLDLTLAPSWAAALTAACAAVVALTGLLAHLTAPGRARARTAPAPVEKATPEEPAPREPAGVSAGPE
ncbi:hypothetical protein QNN03_18765 [Streptomyces sp. GXMU-J15]|uniref:Threonine/serine exporter-like N-terminal domain-containing protein n=1 Tax=Streptomyces fuscus TaxID=3048495 RepID=A0ABT7J0U1_9ACTN|nr:hypothetical protein [Streptomyces fuscus]MDL2078481.1 hypothetical protein [Streptomyces fuscus]